MIISVGCGSGSPFFACIPHVTISMTFDAGVENTRFLSQLPLSYVESVF